jgi:recombinational DNA repair protein (RecF pathway)
MNATTTTPTQLTTCDGCGTQTPTTSTYYVDGAGQLCTTTCTSSMPAELTGIEPPF